MGSSGAPRVPTVGPLMLPAVVVLVALVGAGLVVGGLWLMYPPVAIVAAGGGILRLVYVWSSLEEGDE